MRPETIVDRREIENYGHQPKYELCSFHMDLFHDDFNDLYTFYRLKSDIFLFKRISIYQGASPPDLPKFLGDLIRDFLKNEVFGDVM